MLKSTSHIPYKCYDSNGIVINSGNMYGEDLNKGESCTANILADSEVAKILFFEASVRK